LEQLLEERERVLNEHIQKLDKTIHQQANIMAEQKATITIQANIMFEQEMQAIVKDNTIQVQANIMFEQEMQAIVKDNTIQVQANIMFEQETQAIVKDNTIQVQQEALQRCFSWRQSTFHHLPSTIAKKKPVKSQ
jgi:Periplasmic copper-binding protein (NosD)